MVLSIPDTGLHMESSDKSADTLPLQAFALTLSDNVIEDLIQRVQNGGDVKLSLGNVPSLLCGREAVHKIPKTAEIPNLDLYLTDPSDSTQEAEKLPHPTMSLFMRPEFRKYPKLAAGRVVVKEKAAPANAPAATRSPRPDIPDDIAQLKKSMAQAKSDKLENGIKIVNTPISGVKRGAKTSKAKLLPSAKGSTFTTTISRSGAASPALSGTGSPSMGATLSADELAKERAKEIRSPIVHELAVREMTFEELESRWPNDDGDFKPALAKVADFDNSRQKYTLKKMYWKELDVFRYGYDSDEERQKAIDNAIKMYDRMRVGTTEPVWQKLLPKEERGKGKCLSKLQATIAKSVATAQANTPQIKVHDAEDSSGSRNGDSNLSGVERKTKKTGSPLPRSSSQTRQPAKKTESKLLTQKKTLTPKVSPTKPGAKTAKKGARVLSKEIISDSDSSSEDAPMSKTVAKSKAADMEREKAKERERERGEREKEREREREKADREKERAREREREREKEREKERERAEREKEREREREKEKARLAEKARLREAALSKARAKAAAPKEVIKPQVVARPAVQKRSREDPDDDSSSSSGTPLSKRVNRDTKTTTAPSSKLANKRPPSDSSSQGSSRNNGNAGSGLPSKYKNTSPIKSSPLASSPPTNASDFDHTSTDESRHGGRPRDRSQDRSVTVANGNINVKKRKAQQHAERDTIDVAMADKKRQRVSTDILDKARRFKMHYVVYQQLHRELSRGGSFNKEKYEKLMEMHESLEDLKTSIYSQVPQSV